MKKQWDAILISAANENRIRLIEIDDKNGYRRAYGKYAFTTPAIEKWLIRNDPNMHPDVFWAGIHETIFFTFNDIDISDQDYPTGVGLKIGVYSSDEKFRSIIKIPFAEILKKRIGIQYFSTDRGYAMFSPNTVHFSNAFVEAFIANVLPELEKKLEGINYL